MLVSTMIGEIVAAPAPADTLIEAQAHVTYFNTLLAVEETISTNAVFTRVKAVRSLDIVHDQTIYNPPGSFGQFAFFVRNTGNVPLQPTIALDQLTSDDYDLEDVAVILDHSGNGFPDPGERELAPGRPINIPAGAEANLIVQIRTPPALADGSKAQLELSATEGTVSGVATGTAIIMEKGLLLEKSVSQSDVTAAGNLRYTLRLLNLGGRAVPAYDQIAGRAIRIDGQPASGILVRDPVPINTRFVAFVSHPFFSGLYHIAGAPDHEYTSTPPADLSTVDAVAFFRPGDYVLSFPADLSFEVAALENASDGYVYNIASTWQWQNDGADLREIESNRVRADLNGGDAALVFTDGNGAVISRTALNTNVRLRLDASLCNLSSGVDTAGIRVTTEPEGDVEIFDARETGPNTGTFTTAAIPVQRVMPPVKGDNLLSGDINTTADASVSCGGETVEARLLINPGGFIFDSVSNTALSDIPVVVYDKNGGEIERSVSGSDGFFILNAVTRPGTYRIKVLAPETMVFPSTRTSFPGWERNVDPKASYGKLFTTTGAFGGIDIPLDFAMLPSPKLVKTADEDLVAPGDIITYTLELTNTAEVELSDTVIYDRLPAGLGLIAKTARLNGKPVSFAGESGRNLSLAVGDIPAGDTLKLTYMAEVRPFAEGKLANIAYAIGGFDGSVRSSDARAIVRVRRDGGVFSDEGVILGKVYVDFNGNGTQDQYLAEDGVEALEPGVPGVKIHFENAASVVTDAEGKYSMPGLSPETHVAALSMRTLPASVEPKSTSVREALSPQSRFIRLLPGEVAGEYFALTPRPDFSREEVLAELAERADDFLTRQIPGGGSAVIRPSLGNQGWVDYSQQSNSSSRDATQLTRSEVIYKTEEEAAGSQIRGTTRQPLELERSRNLEAEIQNLSPELDFIDIEADDLLGDDVVSIRIKGPSDGQIKLHVNDEPVTEDLIGQRIVHSEKGVQAIEFIAVQLQGGRNRLELIYSDSFGNERERKEIEVLAPGDPARIELVVPPAARADPSSPIPVLVRLIDADGVPTFASMDVTLETSGRGRWDVRDIRLAEPGIQVFIDRGEALVDYYPPALAGTQTIAVRNGLGRFETEVKLVPDDSERVIVGVVEGAVRLTEDDISTDDLDGFEEATGDMRGALYLKGKIKGGALLTLRYDSNENIEERLFRDIDPERYYPVYGDSSERGFDAQSNAQLYVKVEKGLNYILYGDVNIAPQASEFKLGNYSRVLTGGQAHLEGGPVTINLFAGRPDQDQMIREFRAEGLSGPYEINMSGYVEGSERVEVITRDRRQPTAILSTTLLQRFTDYRLDYFGGAILFNWPIPAMDEDGNPNFIRISYELEGEGEPYWVYAGEVRVRLGERLAVGYREIHSDADGLYDDRRTVRAAYASTDLGKYGRAEAEVAQSVDRHGETGLAGRVGYEVSNDRVTLRARATHTEEGFLEGSSTTRSGRQELSAEADWQLGPQFGLRTGALYDQQTATGEDRWGGEVLANWSVSSELKLKGGMRYMRRTPSDGEDLSVSSAVVGGEWRPASLPGFMLRGEVEGDVTDTSHLRGMLEASHTPTERMKVYASTDVATSGSEFLDFSSKEGMRGTVKAGVEYRLTEGVSSFTEARSGSETGLAGGLRGEWDRGENAQIYASIEHFQPYALNALRGSLFFDRDTGDDSSKTSVAAGYLNTFDDETGRLGLAAEVSIEDDGYSLYGQQHWSQRVDDWTLALENRAALTDTDRDWRLRDHLRVGAALRRGNESADALFLGGLRFDRDRLAETRNTTGYWSAAGSLALGADARLTGKQAGQYKRKEIGNVSAETFLVLVQLGLEKDLEINDQLRVRLGINGPAFYDVKKGETYMGVGGEIGLVPARNVLFAAGYNWSDVDAESVSEIYQTGPYMRLSMKLDDATWGFFDRMGLTVPLAAETPQPEPVVYK